MTAGKGQLSPGKPSLARTGQPNAKRREFIQPLRALGVMDITLKTVLDSIHLEMKLHQFSQPFRNRSTAKCEFHKPSIDSMDGLGF